MRVSRWTEEESASLKADLRELYSLGAAESRHLIQYLMTEDQETASDSYILSLEARTQGESLMARLEETLGL